MPAIRWPIRLDPPVDLAAGPARDRAGSADDALLVAVDPLDGAQRHFAVDDRPVDDVTNSSGGGLQAHDYWNNETEFVGGLVDLLEDQPQR